MICRCLVFLAGGTPPCSIDDDDVIICADSGAIPLIREGIVPDHLVGDMDSLDESSLAKLEKMGTEITRYPEEKDSSDGELALEMAISLGPDRIEIFGGRKGRSDHILSSLFLLHLVPRKIESVFHLDEDDMILIRAGQVMKVGVEREVVSLLAAEKETRLSIEGSRYDVRDFQLEPGSTRCIHNEARIDQISIEVHSGSAYLIMTDLY